MAETKVSDLKRVNLEPITKGKKKSVSRKWEKPSLEDVSGKIMAQPYIRFT